MTEILRFNPGGKKIADILFAARMCRPTHRGIYAKPAAALMYLAWDLRQNGFGVLVSNAVPFSLGDGIAKTEEIRQAANILKEEVKAENPQFVGFTVYEINALPVLKIMQQLNVAYPGLCFLLGGHFITVNPKVAMSAFENFSNLIMVNGEADLALRPALRAYMSNESTDQPGIFIKKKGKVLGGKFYERISLTAEEHESIVPLLEIEWEDATMLAGIDLVSGRGCFNWCSICCASSALRNKYVSWSAPKRIAEIKRAAKFVKRQGLDGRPTVGFNEDSFFHDSRQTLEFLRAFQKDPFNEEIFLSLQANYSSFLRPDGSFNEEIPQAMLRSDGSPYVRAVICGGDFWTQEERARNRGGREGQLTNEQIVNIIAGFRRHKIMVQSFWLRGDEQSTLLSFVSACLFLDDLKMRFAPYFHILEPDPIFPYAGTPIRQRLEEQKSPLLKSVGAIGKGENTLQIFGHITLPVKLIEYAINITVEFEARQGIIPTAAPDHLLTFFKAIAGKWQNQVLEPAGQELIREYIGMRQAGQTKPQILSAIPKLRELPNHITFFGKENSYNIEELLDLAEADTLIPEFHLSAQSYEVEFRRRNPDCDKEMKILAGWYARGDELVL